MHQYMTEASCYYFNGNVQLYCTVYHVIKHTTTTTVTVARSQEIHPPRQIKQMHQDNGMFPKNFVPEPQPRLLDLHIS